MAIEKEILVEELVREHPRAVGFLMRRGVVCIQCGEPIWGTLEEAALKKGIEDIPGLVTELNAFLGLE